MAQASVTVTGAIRRDETIQRLGGIGDNWHMSWADDDTQVVALCDGAGWPGTVRQFYNSRLYKIVGGPHDARFTDIPNFPDLIDDPELIDQKRARYYGFGTLALENKIYQHLSTWTKVDVFNSNPKPLELRFTGTKLIYSPDDGQTWHNQDGSTPVTWEPWEERSTDNMLFYNEDQEAFSLLSIVQMGKGYRANTDGYVYVYAPNGNTEGTMNELVLYRVPKDRILDRSAYEYFAKHLPDGSAAWTPKIEDRGVAHTFPRGWVNTTAHPYSWHPSITYNEPLGVFMMANWGMGCAADGMWFGKPSYLGLYTSGNPWGPWTQLHEDTSWTPAGDAAARCYQPQISPKWIAPDGKSFWLVWTDFQTTRSIEELKQERERLKASRATLQEKIDSRTAAMPYYAFNAQRLDLTTA